VGKYTYTQNNFSSGELSSKIEGRNELEEYQNGAGEVLNFIPYRTGGLARRPGTRFVSDVTTIFAGFAPTSIIDFKIGEDHYLVIMGSGTSDSLLSVFQMTSVQNRILVAQVQVNYASTDFTGITGEYLPSHVQIGKTLIICDRNGVFPPLVVQQTEDPTDPDKFQVNTYLDHARIIDEGSAGTLASRTRALVFFPRHRGQETITVTGAGPNYQLDASANLFKANNLGYVRIKSGTDEWIFDITTWNSSTQVIATRAAGTAGIPAGAKKEWAFASWNDGDGWPTAVGYFQGRIIFGGTNSQPDTIWNSYAENIYLMLNYKLAPDHTADVSGLGYFGATTDSDAFYDILSANNINKIQWITSDRTLQVGMDTNEHFLSPVDGKYGPNNVNISTSTFFGSGKVNASMFQNSNYMVEKDGRGFRELTFSEENGSNISRLLSALSDEIVDHGSGTEGFTTIKDLSVNKTRSTIWVITSAGSLIGVTVEKATGVLAWHKHTIENTEVIDVASIAGILDPTDLTFLLTKRGSRYFVEYFGGNNEEPAMDGPYTEENNGIFMDLSWIPLDATISTGRIDTLLPFEVGDMVDVVAEGVHLGQFEVQTGLFVSVPGIKASYDVPGRVAVGFLYTSRLETLPVMAGSQTGDETISFQRTDTILVKLYKSLKGLVGSSVDNLEDLDYEDNGATLFTGNKRIQLDSTPGEEQRVVIETNSPYPLNVLSIGMRGLTQD